MTGTIEAVGIHEILRALPHRYPFLMVDRITQINGEQSAVGIKNCTINEPHFMGHFPNNPVMPGVLLLEGMAQTCGVLCILASGKTAAPFVYFMTIDQAKFRRPVLPGDTVEFHVQAQGHVVVSRRSQGRWRIVRRGQSRRDDADGMRCRWA